MTQHTIVVVGGSNIDASATSFAPLVGGDSNPGFIRFSLGGVGRNVAENLARLGQRVSLVTAHGEDHFTEILTRHAQTVGYDVSQSAYCAAMPNSVYICVNDPEGEMSVAVNDMRVCEKITPAFLEPRLSRFADAEAVVLDANIPEDSIDLLARGCSAPLFADTVSTRKALRLAGSLPRLDTLKTNRLEAPLLTGIAIDGRDDVRRSADKLHAMGVRQVLITMGADGAFASDGKDALFMPSLVRDAVNTTGCGDAFFAGVVASTLEREPLPEVLMNGLGMAALCALDRNAVSQSVTAERLTDFLAKHKGGAAQ